MEDRKMVVITGGPGAGKTTVLLELERLGFRIAHEVARQIIKEQVDSGGTALPWADRQNYTRLMLERSIASYLANSGNGVVFADRGIPDTLCYAKLIGLEDQEDQRAIREACERYRFAKRVFFAPPWEEIYTTDGERKQDFAEAVRTAHLLVETYEECGYEVLELPKTDTRDRAEFILNESGVRSQDPRGG